MTTTTSLEGAMDAAHKAGEGGPVDGFLERLAERVGAKASVRAVFGEPVERDGLTVIPVARVRWGFGGGAGGAPVAAGSGTEPGGVSVPNAVDGAQPGWGQGGGGGATADPVGWVEIGPDGAIFRPIAPVMPSPAFLLAAGATAALVLRGLARLRRG